MNEAKILSKQAIFELTTEQEIKCSRLYHQYAPRFKRATDELKDLVLKICEDMISFDIPKQFVSTCLCKQAEYFGISEDYLRRLIPSEYKDQAQRDIRLSKIHEGGNLSHQRDQYRIPQVESDDIEFTYQPPHPHVDKPTGRKRPASIIGIKEYAKLQHEYDKLKADYDELNKKFESKGPFYFEEIRTAMETNKTDEELGKWLREQVKENRQYNPYFDRTFKEDKNKTGTKKKVNNSNFKKSNKF